MKIGTSQLGNICFICTKCVNFIYTLCDWIFVNLMIELVVTKGTQAMRQCWDEGMC